MNDSLMDDEEISFLYDSRCYDNKFWQNASQVFDFFISYTESVEFQQKGQKTTQNQPKSMINCPILSNDLINKHVVQKNEDVIFCCQKQDSKKNLLQKCSIKQIKIQPCFPPTIDIPKIQVSEKKCQITSFNLHYVNQQVILSTNSQLTKNYTNEDSYTPFQDQVTSMRKDARDTKKRRSLKGKRKGKSIQSKTQKFIKYMTHYYFNKNFNQYLKRKLTLKLADPKLFETFTSDKKTEILDEIITDLQFYRMEMHYSVKNGRFLKGFTYEEQSNIEDLFQKIVRRAYQIKFQTDKRRLLLEIENQSNNERHYLDNIGSLQFQNAFQQTLYAQAYYEKLINCSFQERLWKQIQGL